mmetsp:Transcript_14246/g.39271  ORF Transcript_14246/g.39271 Transcript_14246/m.39271 type:complete len:204 (+) Transcript_14246:446-1057(+)
MRSYLRQMCAAASMKGLRCGSERTETFGNSSLGSAKCSWTRTMTPSQPRAQRCPRIISNRRAWELWLEDLSSRRRRGSARSRNASKVVAPLSGTSTRATHFASSATEPRASPKRQRFAVEMAFGRRLDSSSGVLRHARRLLYCCVHARSVTSSMPTSCVHSLREMQFARSWAVVMETLPQQPQSAGCWRPCVPQPPISGTKST